MGLRDYLVAMAFDARMRGAASSDPKVQQACATLANYCMDEIARLDHEERDGEATLRPGKSTIYPS